MCDINTPTIARPPRAPIARRRHTRARNAHPSSCPPPFNSLPPPSSGARSTRRRALGDAPRTDRARRIAIVSYRAREIRRRARARADAARARERASSNGDFDSREFRASRAAIERRGSAREGAGGADVRAAIGRGGTGRDARGDARGASDSTPSAAPPRARERREGATARGEAARRDARREGGMGWTGRERDERATDDERAISRMQFARGEGAKASKLEDARERRDATDVDARCDRAGALEERVAG